MRIAFVSHEFPPETGGGGIGTYLAQVTAYLAKVGHDVHVFAGGREPGTQTLPHGGTLHRIASSSSPGFRHEVLPAFLAEHHPLPFDVVEGADFDAPALEIKRACPGLPCVVKLHTPRFLVDELNYRRPTVWQRLRMTAGALRRGRLPHWPEIRAQPPALAELSALRTADRLAAPSRAIGDAAIAWTGFEAAKIDLIPLPFQPAPALLGIEPGAETGRVTFLGRLEERKGVIDLIDSVPLVLARQPDAKFRFVGRAMPSGRGSLSMQEFLQARLRRHRSAVEFTGPRPTEEIPALLADTDILVVPSHWESYGLVCCEGMAAARPVIAGARGGMAEILAGSECGLLVEPGQPTALARGILHLLADTALRRRMGEAGRRRVLEEFTFEKVMPAQLASYRRAIQQCGTARPAPS